MWQELLSSIIDWEISQELNTELLVSFHMDISFCVFFEVHIVSLIFILY